LVFKLGEFGQTLHRAESGVAEIVPLGHEANTESAVIEKGNALYERNCSVCHGISAKGNDVVPDLRYMSEQTHTQFMGIAFGGMLAHKGMVGFYKSLGVQDIEAIHAYLDSEQQKLPEMLEMSLLQKIEYWLVYWGAKLGEKYPAFANMTRDWMM